MNKKILALLELWQTSFKWSTNGLKPLSVFFWEKDFSMWLSKQPKMPPISWRKWRKDNCQVRFNHFLYEYMLIASIFYCISGEVNFLALDKVQSFGLREIPKEHQRVAYRMLNKIEYEDHLSPVMEFLLGNSLLVKNMKCFSLFKDHFECVTLDGQHASR